VAGTLCPLTIIGGVFGYRGVTKATGPVRDATDTFVTDLQNGDATGAYDLLRSRTRTAFAPAQFAGGVQGQPRQPLLTTDDPPPRFSLSDWSMAPAPLPSR
jgi:hypothetical protein